MRCSLSDRPSARPPVRPSLSRAVHARIPPWVGTLTKAALVIRSGGCGLIDGDGGFAFVDHDFIVATQSTRLNTTMKGSFTRRSNPCERTSGCTLGLGRGSRWRLGWPLPSHSSVWSPKAPLPGPRLRHSPSSNPPSFPMMARISSAPHDALSHKHSYFGNPPYSAESTLPIMRRSPVRMAK
jgi:hypothetical protein